MAAKELAVLNAMAEDVSLVFAWTDGPRRWARSKRTMLDILVRQHGLDWSRDHYVVALAEEMRRCGDLRPDDIVLRDAASVVRYMVTMLMVNLPCASEDERRARLENVCYIRERVANDDLPVLLDKLDGMAA